MKYQQLYDLAMSSEWIVVGVDTNQIPQKGWAIPIYDVSFGTDVNEDFDEIIRAVLVEGTHPYISIRNWDGELTVQEAEVFANKQFAMGYAAALDQPDILDCFTGKTIKRR